MKFHQLLKRQRDLHNLGVEELADMIGVNPGTVKNWESGRAFPNEENLDKLADAIFRVDAVNPGAPGENEVTQINGIDYIIPCDPERIRLGIVHCETAIAQMDEQLSSDARREHMIARDGEDGYVRWFNRTSSARYHKDVELRLLRLQMIKQGKYGASEYDDLKTLHNMLGEVVARIGAGL